MDVSILRRGAILVATVQSALTDHDLERLRDALVEQASRVRARGAIVDVTALDVLDSFATDTIRGLAHEIGRLGAEAVIVGIRPDVAGAMVRMGLSLVGITTALDLEAGLAYLAHAGAGLEGRP